MVVPYVLLWLPIFLEPGVGVLGTVDSRNVQAETTILGRKDELKTSRYEQSLKASSLICSVPMGLM